MKTCLYHRSDLDGQCSGAIVKLRDKNVVMHGIEYGDEVPWDLIDGHDLIIVDWSFQPWSLFEEVISRAKTVTWIDHHISAIEEYSDKYYPNVTAVLDTKYAACELVWFYCYDEETLPEAVKLLGRYDVWDHEDENVLPFQYRMRMEDTDPNNTEFWSKIFSSNLYQYIKEGRLILKYEQQQNKKSIEAIGFDVIFNGMLWLSANRTRINSKFFDAKYDPERFAGMISWGWTGEHWTVSLYTTHDNVDCSKICKSMGGGGHQKAAGFQCESLPFEL